MPRVEDYNSYISGKNKNFSNEHYFISSLGYTDIVVLGNPPDIANVDDAKCEIEYEAVVDRNPRGIDGISFKIHKIELEVSVDDYPNDKKTFDFEIEPGVNINPAMVMANPLEQILPTYPTQIKINMRKSMDVKDFDVIVSFGKE
jgi:hypothetical protein